MTSESQNIDSKSKIPKNFSLEYEDDGGGRMVCVGPHAASRFYGFSFFALPQHIFFIKSEV